MARFGELATRILAAYPGARIVFTGAPSDALPPTRLCQSLAHRG